MILSRQHFCKGNEMKKTISFGGLGDCINVFCKLQQMNCDIDHLFVESNEKVLELIEQFRKDRLDLAESYDFPKIHCSYEKDEDYYKNFLNGKWSDRMPINTSWDGEYDFPCRDKIVITGKIRSRYPISFTNTIVVQPRAGIKESRKWNFPINRLENTLKVLFPKHRIELLNTEIFFPHNITKVLDCHVFIGLSGFHNYLRTNLGKKNVMLEESEEHTKHYIRESDRNSNHLKIIKYGSLQEILSATKELIND